jgi:hypothetical protein
LKAIAAIPTGNFCIIGRLSDEELVENGPESQTTRVARSNPLTKEITNDHKNGYILEVRNSIGAIIETRRLIFNPKYITTVTNCVFAADDRTIYLLNIQPTPTATSSDTTTFSNIAKGKERMIDIENIALGIPQPPETFNVILDLPDNPIRCICASDKYLIVGRTGFIQKFVLPYLTLETTLATSCEPQTIELNSRSTKLAIIDVK